MSNYPSTRLRPRKRLWFACLPLILITMTSVRAAAGIWTSASELASRPMSGLAWDYLLSYANAPAGTPQLKDQNQDNNVRVLAKALVYARTSDEAYRTDVYQQLELAVDTEVGGRTLALGRNLAAYVIAADLIQLKTYNRDFDNDIFRPWLRRALTETLDGRTLQTTHERRPNNWGTHAGASRAAIAVYLEDAQELERVAQVFRGYLGDRRAYTGFEYGHLSWQCDPSRPVGINPAGCLRDGHSIDGVIPDDQRRCGGFTWPPCQAGYPWEALQGSVVQAVILFRAGYENVWDWEEQAILRAVTWLYDVGNPAAGDDTWIPHLINHYYGTAFDAPVPAQAGKNMGWTDWTHMAVAEAENEPPTVDAGRNQTITLPDSTRLRGQVSDDGLPDPPGRVTTQWRQVRGPGSVDFADASDASTRASFSDEGRYVLRLTADDGEFEVSDEVTIEVMAANEPPTVDAGRNQTVMLPDSTRLRGRVSDDGLPDPPGRVTTEWRQVRGPGSVDFADASDVSTRASFSEGGRYVLRLTADDGEFEVSDEVTIEAIAPNQPPSVDAGRDLTTTLSRPTRLRGQVSDDGLPDPPGRVTTQWSQVGGTRSVVFADASDVSTTATFPARGHYVLRLTADDGEFEVSDDVRVEVGLRD